jgi:SAM-dependent methyltransferase
VQASHDEDGECRERLRAGRLDDAAFDALLPRTAREKSREHWTPMDVALLAARRLAERGAQRVLDVGSGAGKFCLIAAAAYPDIEWLGIDRRAWLIEGATELAARLGLANARFTCGDVFERPWREYDGFYFFNPFSENLSSPDEWLDRSVELSEERFQVELRRVELALDTLAPGALLVTYHGIGGPIPSSYEILGDEAAGTNRLRTWRKTTVRDGGWVHVETDEGVFCTTRKQLEGVLAAARARART